MKIMGANIGFSQSNIPAPLNYRKFLNVFIITFSPAIASLIVGLPITYKTSTYLLLGLNFITSMLKGIGQLIGNGQVYTPSNEQVEKQQTQNLKFIFWFIVGTLFFQ